MEQPSLIEGVNPTARREFDYYPTPAWMTLSLLRRVNLFNVMEPCSGENAIVDVIRKQPHFGFVYTNDLDESRPAKTHLDATDPDVWDLFMGLRPHVMSYVTNPPFNLADAIVPLAVATGKTVAMLLRLSWLEPTAARQRFLQAHSPDRLIVMPRHDFRGNGQTDSVTSAWFCWEPGRARHGVEVVTKDERDELIAMNRVR